MTHGRLILRNVRHHARRHAATAVGGVVATAVLTASMVVGDSVRRSLDRLVLARLGRAEFAVEAGDRRFRAELAAALERETGRDVAAILTMTGRVSAPDAGRRLNAAQIVGVDDAIRRLALPAADLPPEPGGHEAWVNDATARRLGLRPGDDIVVRVPRATALPADAGIAADAAAWASRRLTVTDILPDARFGRFGLRPTQAAPFNVFVSRETLANAVGRPGAANALLVAGGDGRLSEADVWSALARCATLADLELELRALPGGGLELRSPRVFLDARLVEAARGVAADAVPALTYLVNAFRAGDRMAPYAFAAGMEAPPVPSDAGGEDIVVHELLAADLGVRAGDRMDLDFFVLDAGQRLAETSRSFRVRAIAPFEGAARDPTLMPELPGIGEAASCRDWRAGIPLDMGRIRPKDEAYWSEWRGAPKAFLPYRVAAEMWSNRFGAATAVRWPPGADSNAVAAALSRLWTPADAGWRVSAALADGRRAAAEGPDFAGLFLGLGAFVLAAALMLQGLLFGTAMSARSVEMGVLRAVGFERRAVRWLLLSEAALVALVAAAAGMPAGAALAAALVEGLRGAWRGAVGAAPLSLSSRAAPWLFGGAAGFAAAFASSAFAVWRREFRTVRELGTEAPDRAARAAAVGPVVMGCGGAAAAVALRVAAGFRSAGPSPAWLLPAGALALAGGYGLLRWALARAGRPTSAPRPACFGLRAWARRPRRTLAAVLMPACGWFVVFAVDTHRPRAPDTDARAGPAGGFALYGETALPLPDDPDPPNGRRRYGIDAAIAGDDVRLLALRRRDGADASCLNLHRVREPPLLGISTADLDDRGAFAWARRPAGAAPGRPWSALATPRPDGAVPVAVDASVARWNLGVGIGGHLETVDERGRPLRLEVVGLLADSIFQGHVLLDERLLVRHFPSAGRRVLLVEAPRGRREAVRRHLEDRFDDLGLEMEPARDRLDRFLEVHRAYLDIFLWFGAMGLTLGAAGFGVVAHRNLVERRQELAVMQAVGFERRRLSRGALAEQMALSAAGLALGALAAAAAIPPAAAADARVSAAAALGLLAAGGVATWAAVRAALRGSFLVHLRAE